LGRNIQLITIVGEHMTVYLIFLGILICSILVTTIQMKLEYKKELDELNELFDDIPQVSD